MNVTTLALALAFSLPTHARSVVEPEAADEETADEWDEVESEAEVPEPEPSPVTTEPAAEGTPPGTREIAEPRFKGIGLLATAATLSAGALGVIIARNAILRKNCPLKSGSAAAKCDYDFGSDLGLTLTHWTLNLAAVGFAPAAGAVMGKHHAWRAATGNGPERNRLTFVGAGAGTLAGGVVVLGTSVALSFVLTTRCVDKELKSSDPLAGDRCLLKAFPAWTVLNWAGFAMIGAGAGMLSYGSKYGRWSKIYNENQVRFTPYAGPRFAGLGVSGQF